MTSYQFKGLQNLTADAAIRIDSLWLRTQPLDMRAGAERLLARVMQVFGSAQADHGYALTPMDPMSKHSVEPACRPRPCHAAHLGN